MDVSQIEQANEQIAALRTERDADYAEYEAAGRILGRCTANSVLNGSAHL